MTFSERCTTASDQSVEVFELNQAYLDDDSNKKVNLTIGAYRDENCRPWILPVVQKAESMIVKDFSEGKINHEYLPILGHAGFTEFATKLLLGPDCTLIRDGKAQGVQCLSGTGSLKVALEFLHRNLGANDLYVSNFTWENHKLMGDMAGYKIHEYAYWNKETKSLDFDAMVSDIKNAPHNSVILLHACAHNPTGIDLKPEQWETVLHVFQERSDLNLIFDIAYQGFASGDLERDAYAVRLFARAGMEFMAAQSFAKNFGLYNERIGNLTIITKSKEVTCNILSYMKLIIRSMYSNPPARGAFLVHKILSHPELFEEWKHCIQQMAHRILHVRTALRNALESLGAPGSWNHITDQIGMFSYTGLTRQQCEYLIEKKHVYLLRSGRISLCGLNDNNLQYTAEAICEALQNIPPN